jgi:mono/diheme cytochrome c family protein
MSTASSTGWLTALGLCGAIVLSQPALADDAAGQHIFVGQECNACHAVPAAGVEKLGDDTVAGPSLEGLAREYKARGLERWLKRKKDHEGYTHLQHFEGSDEELDLLVAWLLEI